MALYQKDIGKYRKNLILVVSVVVFITLVLILIFQWYWYFWIFLMIVQFIYFLHESFQKLVGEIEIIDNQFRIVYYNYRMERIEVETETSDIGTYLINHSTRRGFDASLQLDVKEVKLYLNPNRGWSFEDMKGVLLYIKEYNGDEMDDEEAFTLKRLNVAIEKGKEL